MFPQIIIPVNPDAPSVATHANHFLRDFLRETSKAKNRKARVYEMFINRVPGEYVFITTSKDIFLELGSMSKSALFLFAKFLEREFADGNFHQLLLVFEREDGSGKSILVVKGQAPEGLTCFTISPAN